MTTWLKIILTVIIVVLIALLDSYDRQSGINDINKNCEQIFNIKSFYPEGQVFKCKNNEDFCYVGLTERGISIQCKGVE